MTPAELIPYIDTRIEWQKEQTKMENERIGLITATIINQNPNRKKGAKVYHPGDFFKSATPKKQSRKTQVDQMEQYYSGMMALAKSGGN